MSMPELMHVSEGPQRFDVFTGGGRRRRFTSIEKATIVEESYTDGNSVSGVARRHGLTPQQLFGWRRLAMGPTGWAGVPWYAWASLAMLWRPYH